MELAPLQEEQPKEQYVDMLRRAGMRPTKQRLMLMDFIFQKGDRHFTVEELYAEVRADGTSMALATVYNTVNSFANHGLLSRISLDDQRTWFDTNKSDHHHFFVEGTHELIDIPKGDIKLSVFLVFPMVVNWWVWISLSA